MKKLRQLPKWSWLVIIGVILCGSLFWYKKTENAKLIDEVKFEFSGYNGHGEVSSVFPKETAKKIALLQLEYLKKKDFISRDTDKTLSSLIKEAKTLDQVDTSLLTDSEKKTLYEVTNFRGHVIETSFSKRTGLKNGEKIKYRWVVNNEDLPLKNGERTVTVKGLKEPKTLTADELKKGIAFKFFGLNGTGRLAIVQNKSKYPNIDLSSKTKGLKNGENIKVRVVTEPAQLEAMGYKLVGKKTFELKVTGLLTSKNLKNVDGAKSTVKDQMERPEKDIKYEDVGDWTVALDDISSSARYYDGDEGIPRYSGNEFGTEDIVVGHIVKRTKYYSAIDLTNEMYKFNYGIFKVNLSDNKLDVSSYESGPEMSSLDLENLKKEINDNITPLDK